MWKVTWPEIAITNMCKDLQYLEVAVHLATESVIWYLLPFYVNLSQPDLMFQF